MIPVTMVPMPTTALGIELTGKGIHNGTGQLIQILGIDTRANLLHQGDIRFIDIDDKILVLIREKILHHIVSGDIRFRSDLDQHAQRG